MKKERQSEGNELHGSECNMQLLGCLLIDISSASCGTGATLLVRVKTVHVAFTTVRRPYRTCVLFYIILTHRRIPGACSSCVNICSQPTQKRIERKNTKVYITIKTALFVFVLVSSSSSSSTFFSLFSFFYNYIQLYYTCMYICIV